MGKSFDKVLMGAAGSASPVDTDFNRVGLVTSFEGANNGVNNAFDDKSAGNHSVSVALGGGNEHVCQGSFSPFSRLPGEWAGSFYAGSSIKFPASADFAFGTGNFTVELFVFLNSWAGDAVMVDFRPSNGNYANTFGFSLDSNGQPKIYSNQSINLGGTVSLGAWHHVALVKTSGALTVYIDGVGESAVSNSINFSTNGAPSIGATKSGLDNSGSFDGCISNVRVVKGTAVYTSDFAPPTGKLTAITNTKLLTCQDNRFFDNSASAHAVTTVGYPPTTAFGPFLTEAYDPAVNSGSAYFDIGGVGRAVKVSAHEDFNFGTGAFTAEGWIYSIEGHDGNTLRWFFGMGDMWQFYAQQHGVQLYMGYDATSARPTGWTPAVTNVLWPNQWHHWAITRSGANMSFFIDGTRVTALTNANVNFDNDGETLAVGCDSANDGQYSWHGYIGEHRILKGTALYDPTASTCTVPTAAFTTITNTKLLLNMTDGQAADSKGSANFRLIDGTNISSDQKKFGDTSAYFDGNDVIWTPFFNPGLYLAGDFTIEGWMWCASGGGGPSGQITLAGTRGYKKNGAGLNWQITRYKTFDSNNTRTPSIEFASFDGDGSGIYAAFGTGTLTDDAWNHYAVVRTSGVVNVYYNGARKTIISGTAGVNTVNLPITRSLKDGYDSGISIGGAYNNETVGAELTGYIDDFRITNGLARYSGSSFNVPTKPFPINGK